MNIIKNNFTYRSYMYNMYMCVVMREVKDVLLGRTGPTELPVG